MKVISYIPGRIRFKCPYIQHNKHHSSLMEIYLKSKEYIETSRVNHINGSILINYNKNSTDKESILNDIQKLIESKITPEFISENYQDYLNLRKKYKSNKRKIFFFSSSLIVLKIKELIFGKFYLSSNLHVLTIAAVLTIINDYPLFKKIYNKFTQNFSINQDKLLIGLSLILTFFREGFYSILLLLLKSINEHLTLKTDLDRYNQKLKNNFFQLIKKNSSYVPLTSLNSGDKITLEGEQIIPVNGIILKGKGKISKLYRNGKREIKPVKKGMKIKEGMIILAGEIQIKVDQIPKKIINNTDNNQLKIQQKIDSYKHQQTNLAIGLAFFSYIITGSIYNVLSVLLVMNPGAARVTLETGISNFLKLLSEKNIYLKNEKSIEKIINTDEIVFDKTGTLTEDKYVIENIVTFGSYTPAEILKISSSCESDIYHPVANTLKNNQNNLNNINKEYLPCRGVKSEYNNKKVLIGNEKLMKEENINLSKIENSALKLNGKITVFVAIDQQLAAVIILKESIIKNGAKMIKNLKKNKIKTSMISGDHPQNVKITADRLNISQYSSNLDYQEKINLINKKNGNIMMVGDGINDTGAFQAADVSLTFNQNAPKRVWLNADCIIDKNQIMLVPELVGLTKKSYQQIEKNISFTKYYNWIFGIFAVFGFINPFQAKAVNTINFVLAIILNFSILNEN